MTAAKVVFIDDEASALTAFKRVLRSEGYEIISTASPADVLRRVSEQEIAVVVSDQRMPAMEGTALLGQVREASPDTVRIILTGHADVETAIEAINCGAVYRFLTKPWNDEELRITIRQAIEQYEIVAENRRLTRLTRQQNEELREFTSVVSHDLQEPVRNLIALSDALREDLGKDLPPMAEDDLVMITDTARRAQTLVHDLLELARVGRAAIQKEKVSLDNCADRACQALATRLQEAGADVIRDPLPEVEGDATLLTQLYQNLIGNAVKFVQNDPPRIHLTVDGEAGHWVFGVRDNGIGMEPEQTQEIFAPFKRLHGRTEYEGTGIGLAICRRAVERHGGAIWVESEPGKGSHFKFMLSIHKD